MRRRSPVKSGAGRGTFVSELMMSAGRDENAEAHAIGYSGAGPEGWGEACEPKSGCVSSIRARTYAPDTNIAPATP